MIDLGLQTGLLNKVRTLQSENFRSFAEKARGLDPQDPSSWAHALSARLIHKRRLDKCKISRFRENRCTVHLSVLFCLVEQLVNL